MPTSSSTDIAASVRNAGKVYRIYDKPQDRLKQMLFARFGKRYGRDFCALQNVSFEIKRGEALGIIGRNGSGKSTLLQILAGTLTTSWGEVEVQGRVAALLELGSGFNPEFTGRENVYLAAAIAGLSRRQTEERFDGIAAFADIGEFLEQPVKTYSSGMMMRLAFAVQTAVNPDILIIDEALSVGDFFFQQKCARRMRELRRRGTTLLLVSHDMGLVRDLCQSAVYLRKGEMAYWGPCAQAIQLYFQEGNSQVFVEPQTDGAHSDEASDSSVEQWFRAMACWFAEAATNANRQPARIMGVALLDIDWSPTLKITMGEEMILWVLVRHCSDVPMHVTAVIKNRHDHIVSSFGSYTLGLELPQPRVGDTSLFELKISAMLEAGLYSFRVYLGPSTEMPNRSSGDECTPWLGPFSIAWDYEHNRAPFLGMFGLPVEGRFRDVAEFVGRSR